MKDTLLNYTSYLVLEINVSIMDDKFECERLNKFITNIITPRIKSFQYDSSIESNYELFSILDLFDDVIADIRNTNMYKVWQNDEWHTILRQRKIDNCIND